MPWLRPARSLSWSTSPATPRWCDQTGNVYGGWGQMIPQYFDLPLGLPTMQTASRVRVIGSYWNMIKAKWTAGDWVMIQFGHNDGNNTDAVVQANLEKMVADAQSANVNPILVSPPARVQSYPIGDQSSLHAAAAKAAAAAKNCPYIDLTSSRRPGTTRLDPRTRAWRFTRSLAPHTPTSQALTSSRACWPRPSKIRTSDWRNT